MKTLKQALATYDRDVEKSKKTYSGILGLKIGGEKLVAHPIRNGYVYVRLRDNLSEVVLAFNEKVSPVYDFPVKIARKGNKWEVLGRDTDRYENWGTSAPFLPKHADQHSFNRDGGGGGDAVAIYPDQFMPLLVYPSGTHGSGMLLIAPYLLQTETDFLYVGNTGTVNLLQYKPEDANAIMGLVVMDMSTGVPSVVIASGTPFDGSITGTYGVAPYIPPPPDGSEPLYAFRLVSGTTSVTWDNLYNARQFIGGGSLIPSGTYVSQTQDANRIVVTDGSGQVGTDPVLEFDSTTKQIHLGTPNSTSGDYAIIQGRDGASVFHIMEVYGASSTISPFINGIRGDGTAASPTAIQANELMLRLRGSAYDGAGSYGGTSGEIRVVANENHTGSAHGTRVEIWATPDGTTTPVKYIIVGDGDAIQIGDGTNSFNVSPTGDLLLTGSAKYERHFILPALLNGNPSNQPAQINLFTASALEFATTGAKYAFCEWEIPDDWDGSDVYIEIDWNPNSGAMSGTDTIKWDVEYRSLAVNETINNGTSVTLTETNSNDYSQYQSHHSRFTLTFNDANQPLTAQDHIFFKISRDTSVANDFGGTVAVTAFEIVYTSNGLPTN